MADPSFLEQFRTAGYAVIEGVLERTEIEALKWEIPRGYWENTEHHSACRPRSGSRKKADCSTPFCACITSTSSARPSQMPTKIGMPIYRAWNAKEDLLDLLALARTHPDRATVNSRLIRFYEACADSWLPELERLATTVSTWWPEILAFIHTGISNAGPEGTNRVIKTIARDAYGFRNPAHQRLRTRAGTTRTDPRTPTSRVTRPHRAEYRLRAAARDHDAHTMDLSLDMELGAGLHLRTLTGNDFDLLVEATRGESARSLWAAHPRGPYSTHDAQTALDDWDPGTTHQASYGIISDGRMLGALGLMIDGPDSAELAYWVRTENRRQGLALRGIRALTPWAHRSLRLTRIWLEINPDNTPSLHLAARADFEYEQRLPHHCRTWASEDPNHDTWHDCLVWTHTESTTIPG